MGCLCSKKSKPRRSVETRQSSNNADVIPEAVPEMQPPLIVHRPDTPKSNDDNNQRSFSGVTPSPRPESFNQSERRFTSQVLDNTTQYEKNHITSPVKKIPSFVVVPLKHIENRVSENVEPLIQREYKIRQVTPPSKVLKNTNILNIQKDPYFTPSRIVSFIPLSKCDIEYQQINRKVTNKRNFIIHSIEKIENPYLKRAYELKKEQKQNEYRCVEERLLFHGTKVAYLEDICKNNFNWRYCKTHKYGAGISFSPNSTYASNYSDEDLYNKVMLVAKVLIGKSCFGHENMVLPTNGCDTSQKGEDAIVVVKYEDNEFCPIYKINYHLNNPNTRRRQNSGHNHIYRS